MHVHLSQPSSPHALQTAVSLVLSLHHDIHHSYAFMSHAHGLLGEHARLLSGGATMLLQAPLLPLVARKTVSPLYNRWGVGLQLVGNLLPAVRVSEKIFNIETEACWVCFSSMVPQSFDAWIRKSRARASAPVDSWARAPVRPSPRGLHPCAPRDG